MYQASCWTPGLPLWIIHMRFLIRVLRNSQRVWQPLTHHWMSAAQSYGAHQSPSPSLQVRCCQEKWHLEWDQIDEIKVTFLSPMAAGIWVEDGEDSLHDCLQTQAHWDWAGVRDTLVVPPARQNQGIRTQSNASTLSPFSLLPLSPSCLLGDREQKAIVSPLHVSWGREGDFQGMECCHRNNLSPGIA